MAFITYPLNNIDYTAEDAELFHCTRTSGIWAEDSFPISVTGADNNVTIGTGIAWINNEKFSGKVTALKTAKVLDLGIADGRYPRIDVIAIQYSANNNATDVIIKKGTPATNPVRPEIVRSGAVYELYIASVYRPAGATAITASNITDLRMDTAVCGLMADSVTKIDMEAIRAQILALVEELENAIKNIEIGEIVPIEKGGTGAKTPAEALANLGGISKTLLWENASPTSGFAAQNIALNLSSYDFIEIVFLSAKSLTNSKYYDTAEVGDSGAYTSHINLNSSATTAFATRRYESNENGITFQDTSYKSGLTNNPSKNNNYLTPYQIYGIKGVQ